MRALLQKNPEGTYLPAFLPPCLKQTGLRGALTFQNPSYPPHLGVSAWTMSTYFLWIPEIHTGCLAPSCWALPAQTCEHGSVSPGGPGQVRAQRPLGEDRNRCGRLADLSLLLVKDPLGWSKSPVSDPFPCSTPAVDPRPPRKPVLDLQGSRQATRVSGVPPQGCTGASS